MATRRRKPVMFTDPEPLPAAALEPAAIDPPAPPAEAPGGELSFEEIRTMPFFDVLRLLTQAQWDQRMVYIYRQEPAIEKANPKDSKYIGKVPHAFDEEYLKEHFGGGKYLLMLKNSQERSDSAEKSTTCWIEGAAKIDATRFVEKNPQPRPAEPAPANGNGQVDVAAIVNAVVAALKGQDRPDTAKAVEEAIAMMRSASAAAIETAKGAAGSMTGNPLVEKVLERFLAQKPDTGLDQILGLIKLQTAMKELNGGDRPPAPAADPLGAVGGTLKILGLDIGDLVKEAIAGRGSGKDWQTVIGDIGTQLVMNGPAMLDKVRELKMIDYEIAKLQGQRAQLSAPIAIPVPPGNAPQIARAVAGPQRPPASDSPLPANFAGNDNVVPITAGRAEEPPTIIPPEAEQMTISFSTINQICELIATSFEQGVPGGITANLVRNTFPKEADFLTRQLPDLSTVKQFAAQHPILAEIVEDEEFDTFAADLLRTFATPPNAPPPAAA